jgi:tetratricopeptide (TPR) repeat protein
MANQRIFRKKTKEKSKEITKKIYDPFADFQGNKYELFVAKTFYYIRDNFRTFLVIASILILFLLSILFYHIYKENLEHKAILKFEELQKNPLFKVGAGDVNIAITKLDEYIKEFNLDSSKKRAIIKKIELYENNKDYENAAIQYEELSKLVEYPELKILFLYKSAIYFENAKKHSRALANLEEINKYKLTNSVILSNVIYAQVRNLFEMGKKEDAKRIAQKIFEVEEVDNLEVKNIQLRILAYILLNHN